MKAAFIHGIAKVTPLFTCSKCGRTSPGDGAVEIRFSTLEGLRDAATRLPAPRQYIPVGWSSHGAAGVTCSSC